MDKKILKVCMLGSFSLEYAGKELVLDRNKNSKTTQLFQLLMLHTEDGGISKAAMIEALYGRVEVENKNSSLNNTIFRLRKQLSQQDHQCRHLRTACQVLRRTDQQGDPGTDTDLRQRRWKLCTVQDPQRSPA